VLNIKLHLAVDSHDMPIRALITEGTTTDSTQAIPLIDGIVAEHLLADKGYDTDMILAYLEEHKMLSVIPPSNRK
jgi:transposase